MMLAVQALAEELHRRGVTHVFGMPGKESLRLCVELQRAGIRFCSVRHETQAVMMADGFWRASGRLGVVLMAQGAGFGNGVSGMACAAKARSGVLAIAGDLLKSNAESDPKAKAIQDLKGVDHRLVCEGIGIAYVRPQSAQTFAADIRAALDLAQSGCAVSLNIPSDLFAAHITEAISGSNVATTRPAVTDPRRESIDAVADLLTTGWAAARPVIVAGRGAVRAAALPLLRELGEATGAILCTTLPARAAFRGDPFDIGVCGTFCTPIAATLLSQADCVLAFGASLNPFTTYGETIFPKKAHVIQVDSDAAALGKYLRPDMEICADARSFAGQLLRALEVRGHRAAGFRTPDVAREIAQYDPRSEFHDQSTNRFIDPRTLMVTLNEALPKNRVLVIDGGLHLHYACTYLEVDKPRDFVFTLDSLAIGLGMGAAIGASAARPESTTVLEIGDCGFMMSLGDLDTAVRYRLPIVVVVSNDQAWGAEAQHLQGLGLPDDFVHIPTPSLAAIATAMGAEGHTIACQQELRSVAERLRQPVNGPVVLDCRVHPDIKPASFNFDYAGVFAK